MQTLPSRDEIFHTPEAQQSLTEALNPDMLVFDTVRPHHREAYYYIIWDAVNAPQLSLRQVAINNAEERAYRQVSRLFGRLLLAQHQPDAVARETREFREEYGGRGDDDTLPASAAEDYIGNNPVSHRDLLAKDHLAFLTLPGNTE